MNRIDLSKLSPETIEPVTNSQKNVSNSDNDWNPPLIGDWIKSINDVPEYLFKDLIPADSNILFTGKPKLAFKSWMIDVICISAASGRPVGPLVPVHSKGVPVLLFAGEGGRAQTKNRKLWLEKGHEIPVQTMPNLWFSHREPVLFDDPEWCHKIQKFIKRHGVKLIAIDPLVMYMKGDENKVNEVTPVMRTFNAFRKNGATVLFTHHLSKGHKDWARDIDEEVRGSSGLVGFYDQHWAFRKKRDTQDYNKLTIRSKDDEEKYFQVRWYIDKHQQIANVGFQEHNDEEAREVEKDDLWVQILPGVPFNRKRLVELTQLPEEEGNKVVDQMIVDGLLIPMGNNFIRPKS